MPEALTSKNVDYLNQRLSALEISHQQNTFTRTWINQHDDKNVDGKVVTKETEVSRNYQIFDADEHGNIVIRYFNLQGQPYRWKKEETKQSRDFIRKRLREPKGDMKYFQERGSPQCPFFPPEIIRKFQLASAAPRSMANANEDGDREGFFDTLFIVEGEFKAFKGSLEGIDIVGVPSIHGFYDTPREIRGKMHEDLQQLIVKCQVKKVIFLHDADLLKVTWAENKDLSSRPSSFYASIKAFRESLQLLIDDADVALSNCYFMHIKSKYMNDAKGLDDLFCRYPAMSVEIVKDLYSLHLAGKYFNGYPLLDQNKDLGRIFRDLGLKDEQEFFKTYGDFIGAREFKFKNRRYVYDQEAKEVKFVRHEDADKFMRIGPDWVKVITKLNKYSETEEEIVPWKISEIQRDYKKYPDFLEQVQKYDDFCNEPCWNGEYKRVINGCFNLCNPLKWQPKDGSIASSYKFLKHIFQGSGSLVLDDQGRVEKEEAITGDPFTVALDYLSILLRHPKSMLPVPILVSQENGTGKSTFLKWLQLIFGSNMCILGNDQFKMKFNGHYITKFIIAIDEGFLEVDKKAEKERLKQLVTADTAYLENKGMNVRKINYFGKLIICSNDADRVMKIEEGESRWFVVKVPVIPKEEMDPDLELKLKNEVNAWMHFLFTRTIQHPRSHRLWFKPEWFITDQFKVIVEATKNRLDKVFEDWIREQFFMFRLGTLKYSLSQLTELFNDFKNNKYKVDRVDLRAYLQNKGVLFDTRPQRFRIPEALDIPEQPGLYTRVIMKECNPTTPYVFKIEDWLKAEEVEALQPLTDPDRLILYPVETKGEAKKEEVPF